MKTREKKKKKTKTMEWGLKGILELVLEQTRFEAFLDGMHPPMKGKGQRETSGQ